MSRQPQEPRKSGRFAPGRMGRARPLPCVAFTTHPLTRAHNRQRMSQQERKTQPDVDPGMDSLALDVAGAARLSTLLVDQPQTPRVVPVSYTHLTLPTSDLV